MVKVLERNKLSSNISKESKVSKRKNISISNNDSNDKVFKTPTFFKPISPFSTLTPLPISRDLESPWTKLSATLPKARPQASVFETFDDFERIALASPIPMLPRKIAELDSSATINPSTANTSFSEYWDRSTLHSRSIPINSIIESSTNTMFKASYKDLDFTAPSKITSEEAKVNSITSTLPTISVELPLLDQTPPSQIIVQNSDTSSKASYSLRSHKRFSLKEIIKRTKSNCNQKNNVAQDKNPTPSEQPIPSKKATEKLTKPSDPKALSTVPSKITKSPTKAKAKKKPFFPGPCSKLAEELALKSSSNFVSTEHIGLIIDDTSEDAASANNIFSSQHEGLESILHSSPSAEDSITCPLIDVPSSDSTPTSSPIKIRGGNRMGKGKRKHESSSDSSGLETQPLSQHSSFDSVSIPSSPMFSDEPEQMRSTRSGRLIVKPLKFWENEVMPDIAIKLKIKWGSGVGGIVNPSKNSLTIKDRTSLQRTLKSNEARSELVGHNSNSRKLVTDKEIKATFNLKKHIKKNEAAPQKSKRLVKLPSTKPTTVNISKKRAVPTRQKLPRLKDRSDNDGLERRLLTPELPSFIDTSPVILKPYDPQHKDGYIRIVSDIRREAADCNETIFEAQPKNVVKGRTYLTAKCNSKATKALDKVLKGEATGIFSNSLEDSDADFEPELPLCYDFSD